MIRLATLTKRAALAAAALAVAASAAPAGASAAATPAPTPAATTPGATLDKDVVIVVGPEVSADCETTAPLRKMIQQAAPELTSGTKTTFTGRFHLVSLNPEPGWCRSPDGTEIQVDGLDNAALALGRTIAGYNRQRGAVDVITIGSAGPALRYALTMGARKRAGYKAEDEQIFEGNLDVQDAVAIGGVMDGMPYKPAACRGGGFCDDLVRPASGDRPIQWQLMDDKIGRNPQGVHGTDWTLIALAGDRFAPESTALGMDAAHRTGYDVPTLTLEGALADDSAELNMPAHYVHAPKKVFASTAKAAHPLARILQDILYSSSTDDDAKLQTGPAFAPGCTGYVAPSGSLPESGEIPPTTSATVLIDQPMVAWQGDKRAVRVLKVGMLDALATCFKQDPKDAGRFLAAGPQYVRVNGLEFWLKSSKDIIEFDVRTRTVKRIMGKAELSVPIAGSVALYLNTFDDSSLLDLNLKFPMNATDGAIQTDDGTIFSFIPKSFQLFGQKSNGAITFRVVKGGFQIEGSITMPGVFSTKLASGDPTAECGDLLDNDKDGKADAQDPDCDGKTTGDFEDLSKKKGMGFAVGTSNTNGIQLDKFTGSVGGELRLGPFRTSGSIAVEYLGREKELKFTVDAALPAVSDIGAKLKIGFKNNQLNSIYGEANGLNVPLWTSGWYFQRFGIGANGLSDGQQAEILISTSISFLRKIAGKYVLSIDGDLTIGWGAPWRVKLAGAFNFLEGPFGSASVSLDQSYGAKLDVLLGRDIVLSRDANDNPTLSLIPQGKLAGAVNLAGELDIGAGLKACVKGKIFGADYKEPWCLSQVDLRLNKFNGQPLQFSGCFRTNTWVAGAVSVGFNAKLNPTATGYDPEFNWIVRACDVANYGGKLAQAGEPRTDGFTVRPGEDRRVVELRAAADGESPRVTLIAPDGTRYATPTETMGQPLGEDAYVISGLGGKTAFVLNKPQIGQWKVETADGSPKVTGIDVLNVLPEPKATAKVVRGRGGKLALDTTVERQPGQTVRFVERSAAGVDHVLATSSGGTQRTSFRPAFGPSGKRDLIAVVMQDGRVRRELSVGSYVAPAPAKAGRVRGVVIRRKGERVTVTWGKAKNAASYEVVVDTPDGRGQAQIVKGKRRVVVEHLLAPGRIDVQVRALRAPDERPGPAAHAHGTGLEKAKRGAHHHR